MSKKLSKTDPRTLGECAVGHVVRTPCGYLSITGQVNGRPFVRLWDPDERRERSFPFGAPPDLRILEVVDGQQRFTAKASGLGAEVDPVRGR